MDFKKLFDLERLFDLQPSSSFQFGGLMWIAFGLVITICLIGLALLWKMEIPKIYKAKEREAKKILRHFLILSLLGLFLVFAREQYIAVFSMRLLLLTTVIYLAGISLYFAYEWLVLFPAYENKVINNMAKQTYLPKRRKR